MNNKLHAWHNTIYRTDYRKVPSKYMLTLHISTKLTKYSEAIKLGGLVAPCVDFIQGNTLLKSDYMSFQHFNMLIIKHYQG